MNCSKHRWFIENIRSMTYRHITQCSCSFNTEHARAYTSYRESYFTRIFTYILLIIATFNRTLMMPAPLKISAQTTRHINKYFVINTVFIIIFILYQELQLYKQHYFYRKKGGDNILYLLH